MVLVVSIISMFPEVDEAYALQGVNVGQVGGAQAKQEASDGAILRKQSAQIKECSIGTTEKYVAQKLKLTISGSGYGAYRDALVEEQILLPTELTDTKKSITKAELALLASRVMAYKGEEEDMDLSKTIVSDKRISDLSKMKEPYKSSVVWVFGEGVMVGSSNGAYSQSRKFKPTETVTTGAMKSVILKALGEKDRSIMSPDGQLTRTTNLPSNYKKFDYILSAFPNKFYQQRFNYQYSVFYYEPVNLKDYAAPVDIKKQMEKYNSDFVNDENVERWSNVVKENLTYRFNFNYKTVDDEWIARLRNTYFKSYTDYDDVATDKIKYYVKKATENQVVLKSDQIVVEPSTLYCDSTYYVFRCYVKFKISSAKEMYAYNSGKQKDLIYSDVNTNLKNLKKGIWIERYFDIGVSTSNVNDDGSNYAVFMDRLSDRTKPDLSKYEGQNIWCLY
ncbi:MAG: hypothetical protein PWP24_582 [Clostridiales bacterium]|nr:hypothetical protein [Clostridiales bacterium]